MAEFFAERGIKKAACFTAQSANATTYGNSFINSFNNLGGSVVSKMDYSEDHIDFKIHITNSIQNGAEAFYLAITTGKDGGFITKQIRELGFEGLIAGPGGPLETEEFMNIAGEAAEGVIYTSPDFDLENPKVKEYNEEYKNIYNKDSNFHSANSYDALNIIIQAIEYCGNDDPGCVKEYLYNVKDYPSIGGLTTFDENGDVIKSVIFKTIKNGKFVLYE